VAEVAGFVVIEGYYSIGMGNGLTKDERPMTNDEGFPMSHSLPNVFVVCLSSLVVQ
jgi:hypothetical protein